MTYAQTDEEAAELATLQGRYTEWRLWRAGGGSWMATRCDLTDAQKTVGMSPTLMEPTRRALASELAAQALTEIHLSMGSPCTVEAARTHLRDRLPCCPAASPPKQAP
ncbi:hypothetical protein [Actinocorallia sp. A-T 12471]|uniref:hypothetical protein n=1 Tax=Actinocorallia sp. A-T 12471 TaxID=3089813 RepID=UPI0029CC6262|nr:hypothetical protein [Actinocorallia sp. A-T 12471]MDX6744639.1 hypothetical protein [Actinocorallia sp. A-T 12471]